MHDAQDTENPAERFRRFGRAIFSVPKAELDDVRKSDPPPPQKRGRKPKNAEEKVAKENPLCG